MVMVAPPGASGDRAGETLSPAADAVLHDLGVRDWFANRSHRQNNAAYSAWDAALLAQRNAIFHTEGGGYVLDRPAFERTLLEAARGTQARRVCGKVVGAVWEGERWILRLSGGDGELAAGFVLDCSGRSAAFARRVSRRCRADRLVAAWSCIEQHDDDIEPTPATMVEAAAGGWWYAALLPDRRLSLAFFSDPDLLPRDLSRDVEVWRAMVRKTLFVQRWIKTAGYALAMPPQLESAGTAWLEPSSGPRWAAAGDAAVAFDPLSSHGLTTALWTGRRAAIAALAALDGEDRPLREYDTTIREAVRSFLIQRQAIYARAQRFSDQPFWQRRASKVRKRCRL